MSALEATDIEMSVLGSLLIDESIAYRVDELNENMFFFDTNKEILKVMKYLRMKNQTLDLCSINDRLKDQKIDVQISYLSNMTTMCQVYAIDSHINILKDKAMRRDLVKSCSKLSEKIHMGQDLDTTCHKFENEMRKILDTGCGYDDSIKAICDNILDYLSNNEVGISFGINFLDKVIGGLFRGELTTIAARSGVGKTTLALQIMLNAVKQKKKVLLISREMSKEQVFMRNISRETEISAKVMKQKNLDEKQWRDLTLAMAKYCEEEFIFINDKISTISQIKKRVRQLKPDLLIVDYTQLLTFEGSVENREKQVATLSRELKNITLDFDMPVIQLSQMNDEMKDARPWGERPLRDSKALFHDSNNVIFIFEPIGTLFEDAVDTIGQDVKSVRAAKKQGINLVEIIIAKCRDGERSFKYFCHNGPRLHFEELFY